MLAQAGAGLRQAPASARRRSLAPLWAWGGVSSSRAPGGKELEASKAKAWSRAAEWSRLQGPGEAPPGVLLTFSLLRKTACFLNRPMSPASQPRRGAGGTGRGWAGWALTLDSAGTTLWNICATTAHKNVFPWQPLL